MSKAKATKIMQMVNQHQVKQLLGWDDLEYGQFQMDAGTEYLKNMLGNDATGIDYLSKNGMFWRWWVNHWDKRDELFISLASDLTPEARQALYLELHDVSGFTFYPHRAIMESTNIKTIAKETAA